MQQISDFSFFSYDSYHSVPFLLRYYKNLREENYIWQLGYVHFLKDKMAEGFVDYKWQEIKIVVAYLNHKSHTKLALIDV